jgi:DNA adenine methylase
MTALVPTDPPAPSRPALRWFGGKWRLAPWIIQHLPPHDAYVEPYGGAASVLLRKPPAKLETWNDLHGRLVNFFTVLRTRPDELVSALELTPYARAEYKLAREQHPDPLEDARRFYILAYQGRVGAAGAAELGRVHGWRYIRDVNGRHGSTPSVEFASTDHLHAIAKRLRHVQVEHAPALTVLERYDRPDVLHYVDPPYHDPVADLHGRYAHPMIEADHRDLAEALRQVAGMVVLSGRPSDLYAELFGDWRSVQRESLTDGGTLGVEVLWLNPAAAAALRHTRPSQGVLL